MRLEHTGQACIGAWAFCTSGSLCRLISVWAFCTSGSLCTHNVFADTWMHGPFAQVAVFAHIGACTFAQVAVFGDTWMHGPFAQVAVFAHISAWALVQRKRKSVETHAAHVQTNQCIGLCTSGSLCTHQCMGLCTSGSQCRHMGAWALCTSGSLCTHQCMGPLHKWQSLQMSVCIDLAQVAVCADPWVHGPLYNRSL